MMRKSLTIVFALLFVGGIRATDEEPLELTLDNYRAWMKHIEPSPSEMPWTTIDWQPDLKSGITKAASEDKPILLWTMNGHPLGCT